MSESTKRWVVIEFPKGSGLVFMRSDWCEHGSEMMTLENGFELIEALRYKLRMFGVPIEGATNIYCDN